MKSSLGVGEEDRILDEQPVARMGCKTLLLTHNIETIGQMSCNPSIGGIGKSHLVKEIDALGGIMGIATDESGIQFRVLNASKGPAVRATRAQTDRVLYKQAIRKRIENQPYLVVMQQSVDDLIIERDQATQHLDSRSRSDSYRRNIPRWIGAYR